MHTIIRNKLSLALIAGAGIYAGTLTGAFAEMAQEQASNPSLQMETDNVSYIPETRHHTYTIIYPQTATTTYYDVQNIYNPQKIRFLSGGVGQAEQQYIRQSERTFPVKLTFANSKGAFMSDVDVEISNKEGERVFRMVTDGPILLLDLQPGSYKITADNGFMKREDTIQVGERGHVLKTFIFNNDARSAYYR